jgi:bacterioferritin (cytochrome b1)
MVTATQQQKSPTKISPTKLIDLLNERLSHEYDAIIMYGIYSQVANRAVYRNTAREVETHAQEKLQHALGISDQIHSLGGMAEIKIKPKPHTGYTTLRKWSVWSLKPTARRSGAIRNSFASVKHERISHSPSRCVESCATSSSTKKTKQPPWPRI